MPEAERKKALTEHFKTTGMYIRAIPGKATEVETIIGNPKLRPFSLIRTDSTFSPFEYSKWRDQGITTVACLPDGITPIFTFKRNAVSSQMRMPRDGDASQIKSPEDLRHKLISGHDKLNRKTDEYKERTFSVYPDRTSGHWQTDGTKTDGKLKNPDLGIFGRSFIMNNELLVDSYDTSDIQCLVFGIPKPPASLLMHLSKYQATLSKLTR